jgi:hypothetical protein
MSASAQRQPRDALLSLAATPVLHPASARIPSSSARVPPAENTRDKHKTTQSVVAAWKTRPHACFEHGGNGRMEEMVTLALRRPCGEAYHDTQIIQERSLEPSRRLARRWNDGGRAGRDETVMLFEWLR